MSPGKLVVNAFEKFPLAVGHLPHASTPEVYPHSEHEVVGGATEAFAGVVKESGNVVGYHLQHGLILKGFSGKDSSLIHQFRSNQVAVFPQEHRNQFVIVIKGFFGNPRNKIRHRISYGIPNTKVGD